MKGFMLIFCFLLIAFGATAQSKLGSQTPKKSIFITSILLVLMTLVSCSVGYKNDGKEVTWNTWNEGTGYTSSHVDADPKTFEILNDDYGRDKKHAFYEGDIIKGADGGSFRVLTKSYAADNTHVYVSGELIEKAHPATFKVHSYYFAEDANDFYWDGKALNVRDKSTFKILGSSDSWETHWAKDKYNGYYLAGGVITDIDYETFHPIEAKTPDQSGDYAADKHKVFFRDKEVPGADPATFKEVDFYIGQDKHRAYNKGIPTQIKDYSKLIEVGSLMYSDGTNIYDSHFNILPKADVATFEHISDNWYKDKSHVWWSSQLVAGANPKTFQPVSEGGFGGDFNYGKDDKHVFWNDSIIQGADPGSFEKMTFPDGDSWTVFDRNRIYEGKDSPKLREYLKMSMEIMLRYIVGIAIAYGIGKWIYQSIRSRSIDYFLLAIIALMGAVLWLSRGFLISNRVYDFLMIVVWLVAVGCFIISRKSQYGKYLKFATVGGLSTFLVLFVYWNVKAESIKPTTLTTQLRGYSTSRIVEVCFRYNETPFRRSYNLNQYPNVKLLPEQYDVRLTIKPISANVAKLESITLIPKNRK